jgi:hypothetical protein
MTLMLPEQRLQLWQTNAVPPDGLPGPDSRLSEPRPQPWTPLLEEVIVQTAASHSVDVASVRARVRIALLCPDPDMDSDIYRMAEEQAQSLRKGHDTVSNLFISSRSAADVSLRDLELVHLSEEAGCLISSAVHYLQSARSGSAHFGLKDPRSSRLIAYASVSPLDWDVVVNALRIIDIDAEQLSLSRIYVAEGAPHNTISRMLSLLVGEYSNTGNNATISTIVDPNLGFAGSSYRASNWVELFSVPHLGYMYIDGQFCTRRQLIRTFGTDDPGELAIQLGSRLRLSGALKSDTMVFATATSRDLRFALRRVDFQRLTRVGS